MVRLKRLGDDEGFTLVELIIGIVIAGIIMLAIGSALIVGLKTTDSTTQRLNESHDAQISSAYLANDVQSALSITNSTCGPGGALINFSYDGAKEVASYYYGVGSNGETQVTRTFCNTSGAQLSDVVLAHFASGTPIVKCDGGACASGSQPDKVEISFTEQSGYAFSLLGTRRMNLGGGPLTPPPPDITLLATGSSPLWVLGGCKTGPNSDCNLGPNNNTNSLPNGDFDPAGWTTPLWGYLSDGSDSTYTVNPLGSQAQAIVTMASVRPPAVGTNPTIHIHAAVEAGNGAEKLTMYLYDGGTLLATSQESHPINNTVCNDSDDLTWTPTLGSLSINWTNLRIGFAMTHGGNTDSIRVCGVSLDTADTSALGDPVLTVNGHLYVNSTLPDAVRLSGKKTTTKLDIEASAGSGSGFQILVPGKCSGCTHQTVTCPSCTWTTPTQPWGPLAAPIPDPLRFMTAPPETGPNTHVYSAQLKVNANATLNLAPGIYILKNGMSVEGNATLNGTGVMFYNQSGTINFAGGAHLNISAPTSGQYKGVLIFQCGGTPGTPSCTNTNAMTLSGGASVNDPASILGVIYAPASTGVTLGTGGAFMHVSAVIAQNVTVTGNSQVTIGG